MFAQKGFSPGREHWESGLKNARISQVGSALNIWADSWTTSHLRLHHLARILVGTQRLILVKTLVKGDLFSRSNGKLSIASLPDWAVATTPSSILLDSTLCKTTTL